MGTLFFALNMVLGMLIPLALQRMDRRRMTTEERAWVWNFASWGSAVYNFGPMSLVAWGYVTRSPRYVRGLAIGAGLAVMALVVQGVCAEVLGRLFGFREKQLADNRLGFLGTMGAAVVLAILIGVGRAIYEVVRPHLRRGDGRASG